MNEAYHARPSRLKYIEAYYQDMGKLGVRRATHEPKATEHMTEIIHLVGRLIQNGLAYEVSGDVYFQVEKYQAYGRLSKRKLEDLQAGARVEVDERKRHPMDFALVEEQQAGRAIMGEPVGSRASRMAHRMFCHVDAPFG